MILAQITALYTQFSEATKTNPVLAGIVSLWGLGVVTFLLRHIPLKIWSVVSNQLTTKLTLNNTTWENREIFLSFLKWYNHSKYIRFSRYFSMDKNNERVWVGPGYGFHWMFFKGRLFWFYKNKLDSSGSEAQKQELVITMLGRNRKCIYDLINTFGPKEDESGPYVYRLTRRGDDWNRIAKLGKRPLESVIVPKTLLPQILKQLDDFQNMRDWYLSKGLGHKITFMLHGKPGCGKTSLIKALASHYKANLYIVNINRTSDQQLEEIMANLPKGAFLLLEDVDSAGATISRENSSASTSSVLESLSSEMSSLSLTGILNVLDGVIPLDNIIVFMTTNYIEKIDSALLRKGRTDTIIELKYLEDAEIKQFIQYVYGLDPDLEKISYTSMPGCDLQSLVLTHKTNYSAFKAELIDKYRRDSKMENVF